MLSNHHKKTIAVTPSNYEEYFLLYVDNELTTEERTAVEAFVAAHPHLKEELTLLLSTQLPAGETIINKECLLADGMKITVEEGNFLLYIDDELEGKEKDVLRERLIASKDLQAQYELLLKTKLTKTDTVPYPDKKELYHTTKTYRPVYWLRIAAAITLMLSTGLAVWLSNNTTEQRVVITAPPQKNEPEEVPLPQQIIVQEKNQNMALEKNNKRKKELIIRKKIPASASTKKEVLIIAKNDGAITKQPATNLPVASIDIREKQQPVQQQIINTTPVTSDIVQTYNPIEASDNNFTDAVATTGDKKNRSVRGFLRKATRFIERTTNVNPVNDDNELLIGAVAIKLK